MVAQRISTVLAVSCAVAGCGRFGFDERSDAGRDVAVDACTLGPWSTPQLLPGAVQSAGDDWFATPTADELELYFYRFIGPGGDGEIVHASRLTTADAFSASTAVPDLSSTLDDVCPTVSADHLVFILARETIPIRLYESQRTMTSEPFPPPVEIPGIGAIDDDNAPWLSPDGNRLTFISRRNGAVTNLFETTRTDRQAAWGPVIELANVNSPTRDSSPTLSADGLELYFSSDRPGVGDLDVYRSTRPALDQPFAMPTLLTGLSSARDDFGTRLSLDGRTLYFNYDSVRAGGSNAALWFATRDCL